jgi:hypothetical protein
MKKNLSFLAAQNRKETSAPEEPSKAERKNMEGTGAWTKADWFQLWERAAHHQL